MACHDAVAKHQIQELEDSIPESNKCCVIEQDILSILLSIDFYPLIFTQVIIWKWKYGWADRRQMAGRTDDRWTDTWMTNVPGNPTTVAQYNEACYIWNSKIGYPGSNRYS